MKITDEMVEKAARVMWQCIYERDCAEALKVSAESNHLYAPDTLPFEECREQLMADARRFMVPVAPLIRSAALEEAARVADAACTNAGLMDDVPVSAAARGIASTIRSLKDKDTSTPTEGDLL